MVSSHGGLVTAFHFSFPKVTGSIWKYVRRGNVLFVGGMMATVMLALLILWVKVIRYCMLSQNFFTEMDLDEFIAFFQLLQYLKSAQCA